MTKFYTALAAALLVSATAAAAGSRQNVFVKKAHTTEMRPGAKTQAKPAMRRAAANGTWVARSTVQSVSDYEGGWLPAYEYTADYDDKARIVKDVVKTLDEYEAGETPYRVTFNTYNEYDKIVAELTQIGATPDDLQNEQKVDRKYDDRIHNLIVESSPYSFFTGTWELMGNAYRREVTRDNAGNVTQILYSTLYMGEFEAVQRVDITYGTDGKAETITEFQLSYDDNMELYWKEGYSFRDCQWYETDGQLWSTDYIFEGNNKVKSFTEYSEGELIGNVEVTYKEGTDDFRSVLTGDGFTSTQEWTDLENGGFMTVVTYSEEGYEEKEVVLEEYNIFDVSTFTCDVVFFGEDDVEVIEWSKAETEYNENGCPETVTIRTFIPTEEEWPGLSVRKAPALSFDEPPVEGEWVDALRFEFSDFALIGSTTGIESAAADSDAPAEYFTIDGRRVLNPSAGIYILRQGNKVRKVAVK